MEQTNHYLSGKIKMLSLVSMLAVVFLHAYNYTDTFLQPQTLITEGLHAGACIEFLFSNALAKFAVPLFFAVSGFFFFYQKQFSKGLYLRQVKKRCTSVLLVFFILSAASFAVCFVLYGIVGHGVIPMIDERMDVVLGWNWGFIFPLLLNPFAFQLWFLAQLFILCLISPVIYFLVKKLKAASVVAIGALWYLDLSPTIPFDFDAYVFFMLGAYIAVNKIELPGLHRQVENKHLKYIFASAWIALSVVFTIMAATLTQSTYIQTLLSRTIVVLGLISVWLIFDGAGGDTNRFIETLKRNSFSVYLFHEPILHIVFMFVLFYFKSDAAHMALFFLLPSAIIIACAYFGEFLRRKLPRVHKTITGGR